MWQDCGKGSHGLSRTISLAHLVNITKTFFSSAPGCPPLNSPRKEAKIYRVVCRKTLRGILHGFWFFLFLKRSGFAPSPLPVNVYGCAELFTEKTEICSLIFARFDNFCCWLSMFVVGGAVIKSWKRRFCAFLVRFPPDHNQTQRFGRRVAVFYVVARLRLMKFKFQRHGIAWPGVSAFAGEDCELFRQLKRWAT